MNVTINGEKMDVPAGTSVAQLLVLRKVKMPDMVSVELNGEILDRGVFGTTELPEDAQVELLYFMGGGAGESRA